MGQEQLDAMKTACEQLVAGGLTAWSWDDHFGAALHTLKKPAAEQTLAVLRQAFDQEWTAATVGGDPGAMALVGMVGGLRAGQVLFVRGGSLPLLVGAWWPWGDGQTISLRLIVLMDEGDDAVRAEIVQQQRGWLGI